MKTAKRILAYILIVSMVWAMLPQLALAAGDTHEVGTKEGLETALGYVENGDTIRLVADITRDTGLTIDKAITFDLNGNDLSVEVDTGNALEVGAGGVVNITGIIPEEDNGFYAWTEAVDGYGVYAHDGGQATVTYAGAGGENGVGAYATGNSTVTVGYVSMGGVDNLIGVKADGSGANVTVTDDVYMDQADGAIGVLACDDATVTINRGVEIEGDGAIGVKAINRSQVTLNGDLEVYGDNTLGVRAQDDDFDSDSFTTVTLNGIFTVEDNAGIAIEYPVLIGEILEDGDGIFAPYQSGNYLRYSDGYSCVDIIAACKIGETVYFDFNAALAMAMDGMTTTIKLLRNVDHWIGMTVIGKTIVFDVNGHELFVNNNSGDGLEVGAGGIVNITGASDEVYSGLFVNSGYNYGVYAHDGGQVTVTRTSGQMGGVRAEGGAVVHVIDEAIGSSVGVSAAGGSTVTVDGGISSTGYRTPYVKLEGVGKEESDGVMGTAQYAGYLIYSDTNGNTVRAKTERACKLSLTTVDGTYVTMHDDLGEAIDTVKSALAGPATIGTITLLTDIECDFGIEIENRTLIFNLNGHTLDVTNDGDYTLVVDGGGVVDITGDGEFNVTNTSTDGGCGVYALDGGQATVTSASLLTTEGDYAGAVFAYGAGSSIEVTGDVSSDCCVGIFASGGGTVTVGGNVQGAFGMMVNAGGSVTVGGDVSVSSAVSDAYLGGIMVEDSGSEVLIGGDVTVNATGSGGETIGVHAGDGGLAMIDGVLTVPDGGTYIELATGRGAEYADVQLSRGDGTPGTGSYAGYLEYTDGTSHVYVLMSAAISPASRTFDKNPSRQADVTTAITWNGASSVTDVKAGGVSIGAANYSVSGNTLTVKKGYLATKAVGNLALTIAFNRGESAVLTITVSDSASNVPVALSCAKTDVSLYGGSNGSVTISATGGSGAYEYSINNGASWQSANTFGGLAAGTYTAAARDAANPGNAATQAVTIGQPAHKGSVAAKKLSSKAAAGTALTILPPAPPRGYTIVSVTYSSSNPAVAAVDANGNITFLAGGKATITTKIVSQMTDSRGRVKTKTTTVKKTVTVNQPVASVSLNLTSVTIARKDKVKLAASIAPATASSKKVKWTTSNKKVATVSSSGVVTGKTGGTAVITCTAKDGSGATASCTVTVIPIYPAALKISKTALALKPNKTALLKATISPRDTDFKTVMWTSSNPAIATVNVKGKVKAVGEGTAVITATTGNGLTASCTVTVSMIYPTGVKLNKAALTLKAGKTASLRATIAPRNTDFKTATWTSSNPAVATVDAKGRIKAIAAGTAVITAATGNGHTASCTVTVQ